jgi:hypothetical protein
LEGSFSLTGPFEQGVQLHAFLLFLNEHIGICGHVPNRVDRVLVQLAKGVRADRFYLDLYELAVLGNKSPRAGISPLAW